MSLIPSIDALIGGRPQLAEAAGRPSITYSVVRWRLTYMKAGRQGGRAARQGQGRETVAEINWTRAAGCTQRARQR